MSLAVTGLTTSPSSLQSSLNVVVEWSDTNTGTLPAAGSFTDQVTITNLTTDQVLASASVPYDASVLGNLAAGASAPQQYAFRLPDGEAGVGQIQITVTTDLNDNVSTGQGDPNKTATLTETSTLAPYPDLVDSSISPPAEGWSGTGITVSWTVTNQGDAPALGTWTDDVYLSSDGTTSTEVPLGQINSPENLAPGQSYQRIQDYTLPQGISGNYWIIVTTNAGDTLFESNFQNDTTISQSFPVQLTPYADLQVSSVTVPSTATAGQPATFSWTVDNAGTGATDVPSWLDSLYVSTKPCSDSTAILLGTAENPSYLTPGESYSQSVTETLPDSLHGQYYAIVVTNSNQAQYEYLYGNNDTGVSISTMQVQPGPQPGFIHVASVSVSPPPPSIIYAGQQITVNWTDQNTGDSTIPVGANGHWDDGFALSQTPNWDGVDGIWLATHQDSQTTPLLPGESSSHQSTVTLPYDIYGTWYLVVVPDTLYIAGGTGPGTSDIPRDQGAAQFEIQLPPPPDIQVSGVTTPTTGQGGQPITVSWTVTNQGFGPTNVDSWTDEVYLSPTTTLQTSGPEAATSLGTFTHAGSLDPTQGYTQTETVNVPYSISGSYYVIVDADIANLVYANGTTADKINDAPNPIQIALVPPPAPANLQVTSIVPPAGAASGQTIPVVWTITNQGAGATPTDTWSDQIVLSADDSLTSGSNEFDLGTFTHTGSLAAGAQYSDTGSVTLPTGISGTYFLFVIADSGDVADQGSTASSHFASVALPVALTPPPDLEVTSLQTAGPAASGQPLTVNWTVTNDGPGATPPGSTSWVDKIYLSSNGVFDPESDTSLGTFTHNGTLSLGAAYSQSETITLPQSDSGSYTLLVLTDADHDVYQASDPLDHVASIPLTINQSPLPDLQVSTVAATAAAYAGQPITVNWTVANAGAGGTGASTWTDTVYLSSDQFVDPSSVDLGSVTHVGALAPGASYSASLVATVPSYASGAYYLVVQADSGDAVYEGLTRPSSTGVTPTTTAVTLAPPGRFDRHRHHRAGHRHRRPVALDEHHLDGHQPGGEHGPGNMV